VRAGAGLTDSTGGQSSNVALSNVQCNSALKNIDYGH
jgi:hypothetical protein